ncbi:Molybdopterin binding protein [Pluteus cervinus]|uniref:Molybdopterin binding protein n=1 Tax=Pluteus cervinus TaxID=181527 RepID=A0ACD3BDQ5_9AGAR|nr:Molybdopterin binding protein [Pluteus cervinus]
MPLPSSSSSRPLLNSLKTNPARSIHVPHFPRHSRVLPGPPSLVASTTNSNAHPHSVSQIRSITSSATFSISPIPCNSALGEGKCIRTAAALIIGDEILNGKTLDRNSNYFAKYCFENGIKLKRIEVVADKEEEIVEASRRMVREYDFVITSGGIGPTHDDITYAALAKAFGQGLVHHGETIRRMDEMYRHRPWVNSQNSQQEEAFRRMALFPEHAEVIYVGRDIWVPVVRLEGKLCVFPGIPALFQKMLDGLKPFLPLPPRDERPLRLQVFTERPESIIAPYLTSLQSRLGSCGVQVGSYPVIGQGVFVSLIGRENGPIGKDGTGREVYLRDIAREVELEIAGQVVTEEEVAKKKEEARVRATRNPSTMAAAQVGAGINVSIAAQVHRHQSQAQHHQAHSS